MTANVIAFPRRRQPAIVIEPERNGEGWLVIRSSHGWLHGSATSAFLDALELASADSVAIMVRP
jgi:hypothetical protein